MLEGDPRPELGIVPWSQWDRQAEPALRIEPFGGRRHTLRALFAEAEDSVAELDGYLEAGNVIVARADGRVVGHLQLVDDADADHCEIKNMAIEPSRAETASVAPWWRPRSSAPVRSGAAP